MKASSILKLSGWPCSQIVTFLVGKKKKRNNPLAIIFSKILSHFVVVVPSLQVALKAIVVQWLRFTDRIGWEFESCHCFCSQALERNLKNNPQHDK